MIQSEYHISKMDCPSEENMIRMKLDGLTSIKQLAFDIENRNLTVFHQQADSDILLRLESLGLGAQFVSAKNVENSVVKEESSEVQAKLLWSVLLINLGFFVIEMTTGLLSKSMGLVADSLDMLADSFVYGLSLWAVGSTALRKKKVARLSGYLQLGLAGLGITEVIRRFITAQETIPDYRIMIGVSFLALLANSACLYILHQSKSKEAHMKASMVFTSNDVIINVGVIIAGGLVLFTQSKYPDLIIGSVVFVLVVQGAFRILRLGK